MINHMVPIIMSFSLGGLYNPHQNYVNWGVGIQGKNAGSRSPPLNLRRGMEI